MRYIVIIMEANQEAETVSFANIAQDNEKIGWVERRCFRPLESAHVSPDRLLINPEPGSSVLLTSFV